MDPAFLPFVFERFRQADSTGTRHHSGMGLGLAIVRHVIELHGGSVSADSAGEGCGATFTLTLPRMRQTASAQRGDLLATSGTDQSHLPIKVLLVEDDPDAREVIAAGLTEVGFEVHAVSGAVKALELLDVWLPDVVVSDIGMPGMDGYEFIKLLRARPPERGGKVAALAVTAFAGLSDAARAHESGYQEHLSKPITPDALAAAILALKQRT
jgi:CheY-like chemotaxis protein